MKITEICKISWIICEIITTISIIQGDKVDAIFMQVFAVKFYLFSRNIPSFLSLEEYKNIWNESWDTVFNKKEKS